jgi:AAA family ATP:ADP antiporter
MQASSGSARTKPDLIVRWLGFFTEVRRSELRALSLFFWSAFLLLSAYYIIRAIREGFILVDFGAESRSLAVGVSTVCLMVIVPLYSRLRSRFGSNRLVMAIYAFFAATLLVFYMAWSANWQIGFVFFIWVGLFGLMVVSQFWALANGCWGEAAGKRLFPLIMIGANLGGLFGTHIAAITSRNQGLHGLMIIGLVLLIATMLLLPLAWRSVPPARSLLPAKLPAPAPLMGGFSLVAKDRYLWLMALTVVLLNWINSTGEYLFAHFVELHAYSQLAADASHDQRAELITGVYANFMLWYTAIGLFAQTFLVSRLFRWIGIGYSTLILPVIVLVSYILIAFVPIFSIVRFVKIAENATDYSLMSTVRQALFLPTSDEAKFDGKTAIDTFFWRVGDLIQAAMVYAGIRWLNWETRDFALAVVVLAVGFLAASMALSREYRRRVPDDGIHLEGRVSVTPGGYLDLQLAHEFPDFAATKLEDIAAFVDDGTPLPAWLSFDIHEHRFHGDTPLDFDGILKLRVVGRNESGEQQDVPVSLVGILRR